MAYAISFGLIILLGFGNKLIEESERAKNINSKKLFCISTTIILVVLLALRSDKVGTDLQGYREMYELMQIDPLDAINRWEYGYLLYEYILSRFCSWQVFLAITAAISVIPFGVFIYKYSDMPLVSWLIYLAFGFYAFAFSGLRQGIAFAFGILAVMCTLEKRPIRYIICMVIATLFHQSAILAMPIYLLKYIKINSWTIGIGISLTVVVYVFRTQIASIALVLFPNYELVYSNAYAWLLLAVMIFVGSLLFHSRIEDSQEKNLLFAMIYIAIIFMLFATVVNNAQRIVNYYYIALLAFVPMVIKNFKDFQLEVVVYFILILFLIGMVIYYYATGFESFNITPYMPFWGVR